MSTYARRPLGDILTRVLDSVEIEPHGTYKQVTVRLFHKGVVLRGENPGSAIQTARQWRVRQGHVLLSRIDARNGAIGLVPSELDGAIVTSDFWAFAVNPQLALPAFLDAYYGTAEFVEACKAASEGTTNRVRLQPQGFLKIEVPLPPIDEQRRVVSRIEELAAKVQEATAFRRSSCRDTESLLSASFESAFEHAQNATVGDYLKIQSGYAFKSEWFTECGVPLVRNANIGHGKIDWSDTVYIPDSRRLEFARFEINEGDILLSLDRPIISSGVKVARVYKNDLPCLLLQRVGRARFTTDELMPDYFFAWLRSPRFVTAIDPGRSNGVPHISPKDVESIHFQPPPLEEQRRVVAFLARLETEINVIRKLQSETVVEIDALLPSIVSKAFRGEL